MNTFTKRVAIISISIFFVVGLTFSPTVRSRALLSTATQTAIDAAKLFDQHCEKCHGKDGQAQTARGRALHARNLTDVKWQEKVTDDQIAETIKKGHEKMPAFEKKLSQPEIDALVTYVRHFKGAQ